MKAFQEYGVGAPKDGSGHALGVFWVPSSQEPVEAARSYAKRAHYDRVKERSNLHLLPDATVARVVFNETTAAGVEVVT